MAEASQRHGGQESVGGGGGVGRAGRAGGQGRTGRGRDGGGRWGRCGHALEPFGRGAEDRSLWCGVGAVWAGAVGWSR